MTLNFPRLAKSLALAFAGVTLTAQFAHAQTATPDNRPVVRVAVQQISNSGALDPLREQSNVGTRVLPMIYAGLIELDTTGDLKPKAGIAESWKRIDDRTLEFKLRPGVKFHNGDPVTVEDIAFSFSPQRMFGQTKPNTGAKVAAATTGTAPAAGGTAAKPAVAVKGAAPAAANEPAFATGPTPPPEVVAVARNIWPSLIGVEIVDDKTVRLVNALPDVTLEGRLARLGSEIISKKAYLAAKDWNTWAQKPISAGPFMVKELKQDQSLVLVANDDYFGGKPTVREIRYTVVPEVSSRINGLISGQYDFVTDIPPDQFKLIQNNPKFEITGGPVLNHRLVVFDKTNAVLANPKIRQAMTHAIDRKAIVDALWGGKTTIPAGLQWEYYGDMYIKDWEVPKYDVALAKKLLKEAGYKGEPIPFRTMNNYYTNQTQTDQIMLEMWKAAGLNVQMQTAENWSQIFEKGPMRGVRGWSNSAPFSDPVSSMVNQHGPRGQQQRMGEWSNDEFNKLSDVLITSVNPQERRETFARMLVIAEREDPAYTVLHRTAVFYAKRKDFEWKPSQTFLMDFRANNLQPPK